MYSTDAFKPLTTEEINALPADIGDRIFAAAMRRAIQQYIQPALERLEAPDRGPAGALRYGE